MFVKGKKWEKGKWCVEKWRETGLVGEKKGREKRERKKKKKEIKWGPSNLSLSKLEEKINKIKYGYIITYLPLSLKQNNIFKIIKL